MASGIAIHQPNFLPWLGWWSKLARADRLVLLDDVQFQKGGGAKGGNWTNRVQVLSQGEASWLTVPVVRSYSGVRTIAEMEIDESRPWRKKMARTLEQSYRRAERFDEAFPLLEELISHEERGLAAYNEHALRAVATRLGFEDARMVRSSELDVAGTATERLVEIVRALGGDAYLAGGGAGGYQDEDAFERAGIDLVRQDFAPAPYPQAGSDEFVPGLSVADALLNLGFERTRELIA